MTGTRRASLRGLDNFSFYKQRHSATIATCTTNAASAPRIVFESSLMYDEMIRFKMGVTAYGSKLESVAKIALTNGGGPVFQRPPGPPAPGTCAFRLAWERIQSPTDAETEQGSRLRAGKVRPPRSPLRVPCPHISPTPHRTVGALLTCSSALPPSAPSTCPRSQASRVRPALLSTH